MSAMTAAVAGFLETAVGEACDLLGHSMGGRVVLPVAIERPELLRSLILMDTWADTPDDAAGLDDMAALLAMPEVEAVAAWERRPAEPVTSAIPIRHAS